ncbi:MAG TPA: DegV family protein [Clostridia bacterium]|jgi:DegV family protein with EDD domain|nr:DegV family protein [Clostridia bacterium]
MSKIALVTDSTADIPLEMAKNYNINIIPLKVVFGEREYLDGVELQPDEFYQMLEKSEALPSSSQPAPADFIRLYQDLLERYSEVISIHLSSGLSGTVNAARLAGNKFKGKIHVVDSKSISLGIGLIVVEAAKSIRAGLKTHEILKRVQEVRNNSEVLFTLDTLEYLRKGGRIGKVSGLVGSMLHIKPVVRVNEDGIYVPFGKTRTQEQALRAIERGFAALARGREAVRLVVAHGSAYEAAVRLKERLESLFNIEAEMFTKVGPVIGVHTGPGTVGAAVVYK